MRKLTYSPAGKTLIHSLDLTVMPGESVVIVGTSGSDKTTLLDLLLANQTHSYPGLVIIVSTVLVVISELGFSLIF